VLRPASGQPGGAIGTVALGGSGHHRWPGLGRHTGTAAGRTGSGYHPDVPAATAALSPARTQVRGLSYALRATVSQFGIVPGQPVNLRSHIRDSLDARRAADRQALQQHLPGCL